MMLINLSHNELSEWACCNRYTLIEDIVNSKETYHVPIETKVDVISIETVSSDSVPGSEIVKQDEVIVYATAVIDNSIENDFN